MQTQQYPDGFPMDSNQAIEKSYFLSNDEKKEWTEWLKSASVEQQNELVDTLHNIWIENQKQVVPAGFVKENKSIVDEVVATPESNTVEAIANNSEPKEDNIVEAEISTPSPVIPTPPVVQIPSPTVPEVKNQPKPDSSMQAEKPISNEVTKPAEKLENNNENTSRNPENRSQKPVNQNNNQERNDRINRNQNKQTMQRENNLNQNNNERVSQDQPIQRNQQQNIVKNETQKPELTQPQKQFSLSSAREVATKQELSNLIKMYQLQQNNLQSARSQYQESLTIKENQAQESFMQLMSRSMDILSQFEGVTDYISEMTEKLLQMNEVIKQQAKDNIITRNEVRNQVLELQEGYDRLERDNTANYRDLKDLKIEVRRDLQALTQDNSINNIDSFQDEGMKKQVELLQLKLVNLEKQLSDLKKEKSQNQQAVIKTEQKPKQQDSQNLKISQADSRNKPSGDQNFKAKSTQSQKLNLEEQTVKIQEEKQEDQSIIDLRDLI
jgi:hypothetical protein